MFHLSLMYFFSEIRKMHPFLLHPSYFRKWFLVLLAVDRWIVVFITYTRSHIATTVQKTKQNKNNNKKTRRDNIDYKNLLFCISHKKICVWGFPTQVQHKLGCIHTEDGKRLETLDLCSENYLTSILMTLSYESLLLCSNHYLRQISYTSLTEEQKIF